jgi:hypothetical protein
MPKSAQDKFNEYLTESRETTDLVSDVVETSYDLHKNYGYAAGYLQSMVNELIAQLPKAKRVQYRDKLYRQAQKNRNDLLFNTIKES